MADSKESPAVASLKREQSKHRQKRTRSELDRALEDSFPASDPVSATRTDVPAGRVDQDEAETVRSNPDPLTAHAPLVDKVLKTEDPVVTKGDKSLRELRTQASRVSSAVSEIASGSVILARTQGASLLADIQRYVKDRPLTAVGIVAAIAFVFGASR